MPNETNRDFIHKPTYNGFHGANRSPVVDRASAQEAIAAAERAAGDAFADQQRQDALAQGRLAETPRGFVYKQDPASWNRR